MKTFSVKHLLQQDGWRDKQYVTVDETGIILSIGDNFELDHEVLDFIAIPGLQNAHSHAFQYAMAGLAEIHETGKTPDDFWSWREAMYQLALQISPDDLEIIATQLYAEMLRHGYTHVAEFHYVHHDQQGKHYGNLSEMGERLVKAAKRTGIGITLIPIFYQKGGFGKDATEGQRRFLSQTYDDYLRLFDASKKSVSHYDFANVAYGIHSMRAVETKAIKALAETGDQNFPFHIHIAEQLKEIEDAIAYLKKRPVEWMLENIDLNASFHFVHATHLTENETDALAKSGVSVVLCPSTEGNLGDGIFPLRRYQEKGGSWSIGTDSHVGLNPFEELRILDYGQRLTSHKRNTFYSKDEGDSGRFAIKKSVLNGRAAMGNLNKDYFKVGEPFDAVLLDPKHPLFASSSKEKWLSTMVFSSDSSMQYGTVSKGKLVVKEGAHVEAEIIGEQFVEAVRKLGARY